ncbi:uncharacterized protein LOC119484430 [Sebastes umbrosus]|uniref:uncharacterized protein LOC119484430 n=1 Tax=Sebastes umbrosus TaxID=72105 RepID=UPI00189DEA44|nr:uncharacterized protein LOC119484430 [Sebastes umbrosus]
MDVVYSNSKSSGALSCSVVLQMVINVKALLSETELLLAGKMSMQLDPPQQEQLDAALTSVAQQLRRLADVPWLCPVIDSSDHEGPLTDFSKRSRSAKFRLVPKFKKDKNNKNKETCTSLSLSLSGPRGDEGGSHEEDPSGHQRAEQEQQRQRGLTAASVPGAYGGGSDPRCVLPAAASQLVVPGGDVTWRPGEGVSRGDLLTGRGCRDLPDQREDAGVLVQIHKSEPLSDQPLSERRAVHSGPGGLPVSLSSSVPRQDLRLSGVGVSL